MKHCNWIISTAEELKQYPPKYRYCNVKTNNKSGLCLNHERALKKQEEEEERLDRENTEVKICNCGRPYNRKETVTDECSTCYEIRLGLD